MAVALNGRALFFVLALATGTQAHAQSLVDPTRPPAEFLGAAGIASATPGAGGGQIIILSRNRKEVTVNGQTGKLGGKLGDATIVDISDSGVVTRNAGLIEQIRLYGNIDKQTTSRGGQQPAPAPGTPRGTTK